MLIQKHRQGGVSASVTVVLLRDVSKWQGCSAGRALRALRGLPIRGLTFQRRGWGEKGLTVRRGGAAGRGGSRRGRTSAPRSAHGGRQAPLHGSLRGNARKHHYGLPAFPRPCLRRPLPSPLPPSPVPPQSHCMCGVWSPKVAPAPAPGWQPLPQCSALLTALLTLLQTLVAGPL